MEEAVDEIMLQLGADETGRISFEEFVRCRMQLINEIEQERVRDRTLGATGGLTERPHIHLGTAGARLGEYGFTHLM